MGREGAPPPWTAGSLPALGPPLRVGTLEAELWAQRPLCTKDFSNVSRGPRAGRRFNAGMSFLGWQPGLGIVT